MNEARGSALLCTDDPRIKAAVAEAGFVPQIAGVCSVEVPCLREETYTLVVTDETTGRETLAYLRGLTGTRRRALFVVAVTSRGPTGDRFAAWSESADLVVTPDDLPNLRRLAGDGLREKQEFYRRFEEMRREAKGRLGAHA
jgi:DNA-binding response OmpR family regulator